MRFAAMCVVVVCLTSAAFAQMTPGTVAPAGDGSPLVADFNGDGLDDLFYGRTVVINNGISFSEARDLGLPAYEYIQGLLDVNGDGIPDVITYNGPLTNAYHLYIADASRHYGKPIVVSTRLRPSVADVDGDGKDDLVFMDPVHDDSGIAQVATNMIVLRSRGDGTFESLPSLRLPAYVTFDRFRLETGDLDHDGIADMVVRCLLDLVVLHGLGGGKYEVEARYMPNDHLNWGSWNTRLADIDGDGNLDVVTVGLRTIHVLFGDGHRNFPRAATAKVAQLHGIVSRWDEPRDIAIGRFTSSDRNEIAADTMEGDIVFFAYVNGALTEVSRTESGFFTVGSMRPGNFNGSGLTDLYVMGDIVDKTPPQVFYGNAGAAALAVPRAPGRHRAAAPPLRSAAHETVMRLKTHTDCLPDFSLELAFKRDGVFGHAENGDALFDADAGMVYVRVPIPELTLGPLLATLRKDSSGGYSGTETVGGPVGSPCHGDPLHYMTLTATVER